LRLLLPVHRVRLQVLVLEPVLEGRPGLLLLPQQQQA
jgi:hypothetical protein